MSANVYDITSACHEYQIHWPYKKISSYHHVKPGYAWNTVSIEVVGPLPVSIGKAKYTLLQLMALPSGWKPALLATFMLLRPQNLLMTNLLFVTDAPSLLK